MVLFRHHSNILQVYFNTSLFYRTFLVGIKMHIVKMFLLLAIKTQFGREWFVVKKKGKE